MHKVKGVNMPNFSLQQQPQYPLFIINSDNPITIQELANCFINTNCITLCVRSEEGHSQRGGYFFCILKNFDTFSLETIEGIFVDSFSIDMLVRFINHASGRLFDSEMLSYCQNTINFRVD